MPPPNPQPAAQSAPELSLWIRYITAREAFKRSGDAIAEAEQYAGDLSGLYYLNTKAREAFLPLQDEVCTAANSHEANLARIARLEAALEAVAGNAILYNFDGTDLEATVKAALAK